MIVLLLLGAAGRTCLPFADEHLLQLVIIPSPRGLCPSRMKLEKLWNCCGSRRRRRVRDSARAGGSSSQSKLGEGDFFPAFMSAPSADSGSGLLISSIRLEPGVFHYIHMKIFPFEAFLQRQGREMSLDKKEKKKTLTNNKKCSKFPCFSV